MSDARRVPSTDGVVVAVHHVGGGDGPPLLIAHATGFNGLAYAPLGVALAPLLNAYAVDVRGHGATPAPPDWTISWHGFADDVLAAAHAVADERAHGGPLFGFGHSMGGAAMLIAAHRQPELFAGLVLFEPVVLPPSDVDADADDEGADEAGSNVLADGAARRRPSFPDRAAARENFARKPPMNAFVDAALDGYLDGGLAAGPDGAVTLTCTPAFESATFRMATGHRAWALLPEITVPTLVIGSPPHAFNPPAALAPLVAERLPNGTFLQRDDLDHFAPFVAPTTVADLITTTLP